MSASTMPTLSPLAAMEAARLTVTEDLPTPPLPLATAKTRVSEPGWLKGISFSGPRSPRSVVCSFLRCSVLMTSSSISTALTPSSLATAALTSRRMVSFIGHPDTVR